MTLVDEKAWYVVQTHINAEPKAASNLTRQGFQIYLPRYVKRRSHARKIEKVAAPLFPRYIFVCVNVATQRWRSIQSTLGVSRLVTNGSRPSPIAQNVVSALRAREDESGFIQLNPTRGFSLGEKVRITSGVFDGNLGLYDGMSGRDRVAIMLEILGGRVRVSLEADLIEAA
jgi:transcriptional antiterminator RfaH